MIRWKHPRHAIHVCSSVSAIEQLRAQVRDADGTEFVVRLDQFEATRPMFNHLADLIQLDYPISDQVGAEDTLSEFDWLPPSEGYLLVFLGADETTESVRESVEIYPRVVSRWQVIDACPGAVVIGAGRSQPEIVTTLQLQNDWETRQGRRPERANHDHRPVPLIVDGVLQPFRYPGRADNPTAEHAETLELALFHVSELLSDFVAGRTLALDFAATYASRFVASPTLMPDDVHERLLECYQAVDVWIRGDQEDAARQETLRLAAEDLLVAAAQS